MSLKVREERHEQKVKTACSCINQRVIASHILIISFQVALNVKIQFEKESRCRISDLLYII